MHATATEIVVINHGRKIKYAAPEKLLGLLEGKVWQWVIPSTELTALKQKHIISATVRREDGLQVRVISEAPPSADALPIAPSLEDVYLQLVSENGTKQ